MRHNEQKCFLNKKLPFQCNCQNTSKEPLNVTTILLNFRGNKRHDVNQKWNNRGDKCLTNHVCRVFSERNFRASRWYFANPNNFISSSLPWKKHKIEFAKLLNLLNPLESFKFSFHRFSTRSESFKRKIYIPATVDWCRANHCKEKSWHFLFWLMNSIIAFAKALSEFLWVSVFH